uniref:EF-hand domain-containing protein n=1 Tax=Hyaloperonospora arabidopsidis (strain Emoy2) TaxID=559515 RepID=M4B469_HYAAE
MGNKQAKPTPPPTSASRSAPSSAPASTPSCPAPIEASSVRKTAPAPSSAPLASSTATSAPPQSLLETKLADVDVSAIFSPYEMRSIRKHLAAVLGQHEKDAVVIPKDEFFRFLAGGDGSTSSLYANRLYAIFDMEKKGHVTFENLMKGLSLLSQKATREQKLMLSFYLLDPKGTGVITKKMTTELLRSCLDECNDGSLWQECLAHIVDNTFMDADLDHNGVIDLNEYQALDAKHPGLFDFLTVDAFGVLSHLEKVHSMSVTVPQH